MKMIEGGPHSTVRGASGGKNRDGKQFRELVLQLSPSMSTSVPISGATSTSIPISSQFVVMSVLDLLDSGVINSPAKELLTQKIANDRHKKTSLPTKQL